MRVRKMDDDGDMVFGQGGADFHADGVEAVAQIVGTRLNLYLGDWFLDLLKGTRWAQRVLGRQRGQDLRRDATIRQRISASPGVNSILSYSSSLDRATRALVVNCVVDTVYGPTPLVLPVTRDPTPYFEQGFAQP